jgi:hypothetical protein
VTRDNFILIKNVNLEYLLVNNPTREVTKPYGGGIGLNKGVQGRNSDLFCYIFSKRKEEAMIGNLVPVLIILFVMGFVDATKQMFK